MTEPSEQAAEIIQAQAGFDPFDFAFVLGTGLAHVADNLEDQIVIPYADLPGFPDSEISGHDNRLVIGTQEGIRVVYLLGRAHYYEKGDPRAMASALETLALIGVQAIVFTNAAGSVNADMYPGTLVQVTDHINFNGLNPLIGVAADGGFVSLTEAYDKRLVRRMKRAALAAGVGLREGVYMWFSGPSFETPAEIRMARTLGADLVGMSTVPEVILARRLALRVAAISVVTNFAAGFNNGNPSHSETKDVAMQGAIGLRRLIRSFLKVKEEGWTATPLGERGR
jgi:purine-nucleoside phosphorylase